MPLPRRAVLTGALPAGGLLTAALAGCTLTDPTVTGRGRDGGSGRPRSESPRASASPVPALPGAVAAALVEEDLLAQVTAVRGHDRYPRLPGARRRLLHGLQEQHHRHVAALRSPDPTAGPALAQVRAAVPTVRATRSSLADLLAALTAAERSAAARHLTTAEQTTGLAALLFGSLSCAATTYATALTVDAAPAPAAPGPVLVPAPWSGVQAEQDLLAQTHAAIYGLQAALGFVAEDSGTGRQLAARTLAYQRLRDRLRALLVEQEQDAPAAAPGYRLPLTVRDVDSATTLARHVEVALLPHLGRWVAAEADPPLRDQALRLLTAAASSAAGFGAGVQVWPGWG